MFLNKVDGLNYGSVIDKKKTLLQAFQIHIISPNVTTHTNRVELKNNKKV